MGAAKNIFGSIATGGLGALGGVMPFDTNALPKAPDAPPTQGPAPAPPDATDEALRKAKLMERRRQLGLQGRMTTFLTGSQGDTAAPQTDQKTLLGQ